MFKRFFYLLREYGIPVRPTDFLRLQKALASGLVTNLLDLYVVARTVLIKSEKYFDVYDQLFAHHFQGKEIDAAALDALTSDIEDLLAQWLSDPKNAPFLTEEEKAKLAGMDPDEVMEYFRKRLAEQTERHDGGDRWIGTGGRSPVGHGGVHPDGMRVGGGPGNRSAIKVAMDRRFIDYAQGHTLTTQNIGEALDRLRHLTPSGPRDQLNIDESIRETVRQAGEIELIFDRRRVDKLKLFIFLDNGGWSMTPFVRLTRTLFSYTRAQFKDVRFFYFHNCVYDMVYEDPARYEKPVKLVDLFRKDPETRVIIVGDASMSPYELTHPRGAIDYSTPQSNSGMHWLRRIKENFAHTVWINPIPEDEWGATYGAYSLTMIREQIPMFELSVPGLEAAVGELMTKYPRPLPVLERAARAY